MSTAAQSNIAQVGDRYDEFSALHAVLSDSDLPVGSNLHLGYWNDEHDEADLATATEQLTRQMLKRLAPRPGQRILDVGCGVGQPAMSLAGACDVEVLGISVSRRQVEQATARASEAGLADRVRFEYANAMQLPYPDASFDAAWLFESLIHMPEKERALKEVARVLKPGSRLAVADMFHRPGHDWPLEGSEIVTAVGLDDYQELFDRAGLRLLEIDDVSDHTIVPLPIQTKLKGLLAPHREALVRAVGEGLVNQLIGPEEGVEVRPGGGLPGYVLIAGERP